MHIIVYFVLNCIEYINSVWGVVMAKLKAENLNVGEILERMIKAAGVDNAAELAVKLGLSPQALQQSKGRQSISLSLLMAGAELGKVTLDYLVFGSDDAIFKGSDEESKYIDIKRIGGGTVLLSSELLQKGVSAATLLAYILADKYYIIDTSQRQVVDGLYAFGNPDKPAVRKCSLEMDGSVLVEGKTDPQSTEDLNKYGIVGRVVWSGSGR